MPDQPAKPPREVRSFTVPMKLSQRAASHRDEEGSGAVNLRTLSGYAAMFGKWSEDLGGFREQIAPGAFARSLEDDGPDVRALADHRPEALAVLGRRSAGTLRLEEDETGLRVEIDLPDTTAARDLEANIEAGNVSGMSFGFVTRADSWDFADGLGGLDERTLRDVELIEVSVVAYPAYPDTSVAARSHEAARAQTLSHETPSAPLRSAAVRRSVIRKLTTR